MAAQGRTAVVALCLVVLVVAAASLPAASAYGCFDDCYERCANGKEDSACTNMCKEACGNAGGGPMAGAVGAGYAAGAAGASYAAGVAAGAGAAAATLNSGSDKALDDAFKEAPKAPAAGKA